MIAASAAADCPSFVSLSLSRAPANSSVLSVISHLQQSFMLLASGQGDATSADLAFVIVGEAVKHGAETEYGIALAIYNAPPTPQHQLAAIAGLTSTRSPALIQPTAAMLMSGQVAEQNMLSFLVVRPSISIPFSSFVETCLPQGLAENHLSRRTVWQFLKGAYAGLEVQLAGSLVLGKLVQICFQSFALSLVRLEPGLNIVLADFLPRKTQRASRRFSRTRTVRRSSSRWNRYARGSHTFFGFS